MRQKKEFGKFCVLTKKETKQKEAREDKHEWLFFFVPRYFLLSTAHPTPDMKKKKKRNSAHAHTRTGTRKILKLKAKFLRIVLLNETLS
jgi:hypothetical protein